MMISSQDQMREQQMNMAATSDNQYKQQMNSGAYGGQVLNPETQ